MTLSNVDFSHRLNGIGANPLDDMEVTISIMTERALGVLHSIAVQFEQTNAGKVSDALLCGAIYSAIAEIEDMNAVIKAFIKLQEQKDV